MAVATGGAAHAVGAPVPLTLSVTNTGSTACRVGLDADAVELLVVSGQDRIWSSDDCASDDDAAAAREVVLAPGAAETREASWDGARSAPGCPGGQPEAQPGTYRATARVGGSSAAAAVFRLSA